MNKGIFLLLGSNQGNRMQNLQAACDAITGIPATILKMSKIYRTAAWGKIEQDDYYNQAIEISTPAGIDELLKQILRIERQLGRIRLEKWGPRIIDIDILLYNDLIVDKPKLTIPHPRMAERKFALVPLSEIATDVVHPVFRKTIRELKDNCTDPLEVSEAVD
jgi:2-amino-4-hydroxy-6-hydroxymethyldihydropteridine diphosphokinase